MQRAAYLLLFPVLLCLPSLVLAQNDDPFGGSDPFRAPQNIKPNPPNNLAPPQRVKLPAIVHAEPHGSSDTVSTIRKALEQTTSQSFVEVPLAEAVQKLSDTHQIPIVIDQRALEEIGLSFKEPISLSLQGVSLRSFLRLMLRDLDMTYIIKDDVMQITTVQAAEQNLVIEMYRLPDDLIEESDKIVHAVTATVIPDAWDVLGGPCTITNVKNVLIVSATERIHEEIRSFLDKLKNAMEGGSTSH